MEATYTFTEEDYWESVRFQWSGRRARSILISNSLVPLVLFFGIGVEQRNFLAYVVPGCLASLVFLPINLWLRRRKAKNWLARNQHTFSQVTVGVSPEGCRVKNSTGDLVFRWPIFRSVTKSGSYVYFIFKTWGVTSVPDRAFANPADSRSFLDAATAYWQSATGAAGPTKA